MFSDISSLLCLQLQVGFVGLCVFVMIFEVRVLKHEGFSEKYELRHRFYQGRLLQAGSGLCVKSAMLTHSRKLLSLNQNTVFACRKERCVFVSGIIYFSVSATQHTFIPRAGIIRTT